MGILSSIVDGVTQRTARVLSNGALKVAIAPSPLDTAGALSNTKFFTALLGDGGANTGNTGQVVDGSVTPVEYYVGAAQDYDIYITHIAILIGDAGVTHNEFGGINPLSVGWDLSVFDGVSRTYIINKAKTGGQVIAASGFFSPYGNTSTTWELTNWTGSTDATTVMIPIKDFVPGGLKIGRQTRERLSATVNDAHAGITEMWVKVFGYTKHA